MVRDMMHTSSLMQKVQGSALSSNRLQQSLHSNFPLPLSEYRHKSDRSALSAFEGNAGKEQQEY